MQLELVSPMGKSDDGKVQANLLSVDAEMKDLTVHLLDNGKWNANHLFSSLETALQDRVRHVSRSKKAHYSVNADTATIQEIARSSDFVVTGVGD